MISTRQEKTININFKDTISKKGKIYCRKNRKLKDGYWYLIKIITEVNYKIKIIIEETYSLIILKATNSLYKLNDKKQYL